MSLGELNRENFGIVKAGSLIIYVGRITVFPFRAIT